MKARDRVGATTTSRSFAFQSRQCQDLNHTRFRGAPYTGCRRSSVASVSCVCVAGKGPTWAWIGVDASRGSANLRPRNFVATSVPAEDRASIVNCGSLPTFGATFHVPINSTVCPFSCRRGLLNTFRCFDNCYMVPRKETHRQNGGRFQRTSQWVCFAKSQNISCPAFCRSLQKP